MLVEDSLSKILYIDLTRKRFWVENRERFRPRSARALRYELSQKGLSKEVIEEVLETFDEEQSAWAAVARYVPRWDRLNEKEFKKKALGLLYRRGFDYEISRVVQRRAWELLQTSRTVKEEPS